MVKRKKISKRNKDNTLAILTHAIGVFSYIFGALLVFLLTKDKEVKEHAKNALDWQISLVVYLASLFLLSTISSFLMWTFSNIYIIFLFSMLISVLQILNIILCVVAAFKANEGIIWHYPLAINFMSRVSEKEINGAKKRLKKTYKKIKKDLRK